MPTTRLIYPRGRRGSTRLSRTLRAVWRDTSALWREFGPSILLFALVVIGGGWLYGELHVLAGNPRIPFNDLPYYVLQCFWTDTMDFHNIIRNQTMATTYQL